MWTREFWARTGERALKTFAQTLVVLWTADAGLNVLQVDLVPALGVGAGAALLSVLTSIGSGSVTGSPSLLGPSVVVDEPGRHTDLDGDGRIG